MDAGFDPAHYRDVDADLVKVLLLRQALHEGTFDELLSRELADGRPVRPMELATLVHKESASIAYNVAEVSMRRGENVVIQGTLAWDEQPRRLLAKLDEFEYQELLILDVESDLDAVLDRSLERWWVGRNDPSDDLGGRFVPTELIRNLFLPDGSTKCRANAEVMLALSDRMRTELRVSFTRSGMHTETVTTRGTGIEGAQFPSLGGPD